MGITEQEIFPAPFALRNGYNRPIFLNLEERMESPQPVIEPVKKNQTPLIIAAVAIVLCCCCLVLAVAGYSFFGVARSTTQPELPFQPTPDTQVPSTNPGDYETPTSTDIGEAPTGGLGNDILRNDTWTYVAAAAQGQGCDQPISADTTIDVLQEPQNGVWVEQWNVACASGDTYSYEITFTLDDTGATFNIKSLQ